MSPPSLAALQTSTADDVVSSQTPGEIMSEPERARTSAPWIAAGALGIVVIALAVTLFAVVLPAKHDHQHSSPYALSSDEQHAVTAGATEAVNILSFSRKNFDHDFQRALDGATGAVKTDLQGKKATTLATMTKNKIDLRATVAESAYEGSDTAHGVQVMITLNGFKVDNSGKSSVATPQRLEFTMIKSAGKWLVSGIQAVAIQ